ncbi:MAG: nucleotidyltransferase domain-containing protein, partial [Thermodesulfobacteriota bacterium]
VDLLVVAPTKERFFERMASVRRLIRDLRDGLPVSPIVLTPGELEKRREAGDPFVREILETGVSL